MKKQILHLIIMSILIASSLCATSVEIEYLGSLENNLFAPTSITVDNNSLAVLEPFSKEIKIFTPNGFFQQKLHIQGDANSISKLAVDEYLYCDFEAHRIAYVNLNQDEQTDYFEHVYSFTHPIDIIIDTKIRILDAEAKQIVQFDRQKGIESILQLKDNENIAITYPSSFTRNSKNGNFYIIDQTTSKIWITDSSGVFIKSFSAYGGGEGELTRGGDISISSQGLVIVSDRYQNRVSIFTENGEYLNMIPNEIINVDFKTPTGVTVDENDILYVASTENSKIEMFHLTGTFTETEAFTMEQIRPLPFDTVQMAAIDFFTTAVILQESVVISAFDFEIFTLEDNQTPVASSYTVVPTQTFDSLQNKIIFSAQWTTSESLNANSDYKWHTRVHTLDSVFSWSEFQMFSTSGLPISFSLAQNYPNPFNPKTTIDFTLAKQSDVVLEIFNLNGQKVKTLINKSLPTGKHSIDWVGDNINGQQAATGIYFYRLTTAQFVETKKMVLIK